MFSFFFENENRSHVMQNLFKADTHIHRPISKVGQEFSQGTQNRAVEKQAINIYI